MTTRDLERSNLWPQNA